MEKYLLFDADGTLYDFGASENIALRDLFSHYGIALEEEIISCYHECNGYCWDQLEKGLMTQAKLKSYRFKLFFDKLGIDIDANEAGEFFIDKLSEHGIMFDGAVDFLSSIKDRRKSIITNGIAKVQYGRIDDSRTRDYFEHIFISEEIGSSKPSPEFFRYVLSTLNIPAGDCLVIGDSESSDIQGAINAGIDSVYINFRGTKSDKASYSVSSFRELEDLLATL